MKRAALSLVAAIAVAALFAGTASARELVYGSWVSPKHGAMRYGLPPLFNGVEKDTHGAVKWKLLAGGQVVNLKGTLPAVRDGLIDAGMAIPSFTAKAWPAVNLVYAMLFFSDDTVAASGAANETILLHCPECLAEFKKNHTVFIGGYTPTPFKLLCRSPVRTIADLKGLKIRVAAGGDALFSMAGATPVAMSPAEATTALQRGTLDCVWGAVSWLRTYGYEDVAHDVLDYPLGMHGPVLLLLLNRGTWNKFTPAEKKAHLKYAPDVVARTTIDGYIKLDGTVLKAALKNGVKLTHGGKGFDELVKKFSAKERATNIKVARQLGVKHPEQIVAAYEAAMKKWQGLAKQIGDSDAKFTAALKREIYDKLKPGSL